MRNDKKASSGVNSSGWTDSNTKKSVYIVSGLFKGESHRLRNIKIVGILLAFTSGIAAVILISTQSQGSQISTRSQGSQISTRSQGSQILTQSQISQISTRSQRSQLSTQSPGSQAQYNPLQDPNCSNCTCLAYIDLVLDITTDLTPDAFQMQNEFVNYYISQLYDPHLLDHGSLVDINYGVDGGDFGMKWPDIFDNRTLKEYFEDGDILRKKQKRGEFNNLYNILLGIFLNDVFFCIGREFLNCYNGRSPTNNIVFMSSPPIKAPPYSNFDLTSFHTTYNGTKEINFVNHYLHGPTGRNKFIIPEQWNKTNFQAWLDAGLRVLQYNNDDEQLLYDLREQLSCDFSDSQTYINLPDIKKTSFSNVKFTTKAMSNDFTVSSSIRQNTKHQSSTKKQN